MEAKGRFPELQECDQQFIAGLLCNVPLKDVLAALGSRGQIFYREDLIKAMGEHWIPLGSGRRQSGFGASEIAIARPREGASIAEWRRAFDASEVARTSAVADLSSERGVAMDLREKLRAAEERAEEYESRFLGADGDSRYRRRFDEVELQERDERGDPLGQGSACGRPHLYWDERVLARFPAYGYLVRLALSFSRFFERHARAHPEDPVPTWAQLRNHQYPMVCMLRRDAR
jgi:hypothetical protein